MEGASEQRSKAVRNRHRRGKRWWLFVIRCGRGFNGRSTYIMIRNMPIPLEFTFNNMAPVD